MKLYMSFYNDQVYFNNNVHGYNDSWHELYKPLKTSSEDWQVYFDQNYTLILEIE